MCRNECRETSGERKEKREREEMGQERIYRSVHAVTLKAVVGIPFVGNTNLQAEMPFSEKSRICEAVSSLGHNLCVLPVIRLPYHMP